MDIIFLRELKVETVIGIWEWERHVTQIVSIDLEMAADVKRAAEADRIDQGLNYKDVAKRVVAFVEGARFQLVESLADAIARIVVQEFRVPWVKVSVAKPGAIEGSKEVGVVIERRTEDYV
ncbi:MAG TPA: dihydroneopterin aldolase [Gammaproteobacteria bacterium]